MCRSPLHHRHALKNIPINVFQSKTESHQMLFAPEQPLQSSDAQNMSLDPSIRMNFPHLEETCGPKETINWSQRAVF